MATTEDFTNCNYTTMNGGEENTRIDTSIAENMDVEKDETLNQEEAEKEEAVNDEFAKDDEGGQSSRDQQRRNTGRTQQCRYGGTLESARKEESGD